MNRGYGISQFWDGRSATLEAQVLEPIVNPREMESTLETASARTGFTRIEISEALASYVRTIRSGESLFDRYISGVAWHDGEFQDHGRFAITGAFKTPTLREVEHTAPYMHDGSLQTLEEFVEYYDRGGNLNPHLDTDIRPLHLTAEEKRALVEFLRTLNGIVRDGL